MSDRRDDDEGLGWAGDDDPTLAPVTTTGTGGVTGAGSKAAAPGAPARRTVEEEADEAEDLLAEKDLAEAEKATAQTSSVALIAYGVLGGVYLLYTIGWVISFTTAEVAEVVTFGVVSDLVARTLAIAASPLWFIATLLLTQKKDMRYTFLWLVIGMLVLVPWPFLIGRAA
ncbi:hypothetical protein [Herbiconiux liukaitaii]|uniref:hypothetical protein n=1 Tax=Herbiconiux liukaitaii TaxID=3342799 RepID=UPI0035B70410